MTWFSSGLLIGHATTMVKRSCISSRLARAEEIWGRGGDGSKFHKPFYQWVVKGHILAYWLIYGVHLINTFPILITPL